MSQTITPTLIVAEDGSRIEVTHNNQNWRVRLFKQLDFHHSEEFESSTEIGSVIEVFNQHEAGHGTGWVAICTDINPCPQSDDRCYWVQAQSALNDARTGRRSRRVRHTHPGVDRLLGSFHTLGRREFKLINPARLR